MFLISSFVPACTQKNCTNKNVFLFPLMAAVLLSAAVLLTNCGGGGGGSDTPASDTPASDTPASDTPASDTPASDTPASDTPYTFGTEALTPNNVETDDSFIFSVDVTFEADIADGLTTHLYQSAAGENNADTDTGVSGDLGERSASTTADLTLAGTAPDTAGTYQYRLCIGAGTSVCSETAALTVAASTSPSPGERFALGALEVPDSTLYEGETLELSVDVTNMDDTSSIEFTAKYYQSADATIDSSDTSEGEVTQTIAPDGTETLTFSHTLGDLATGTDSTSYYGACVTHASVEKCSAGVEVTTHYKIESLADLPEDIPFSSSDDTAGLVFQSSDNTLAGDDSIALLKKVTDSGSSRVFYFVSFDADNTVETSDKKLGNVIQGDTTAQISYRGTLWNIQVFDSDDDAEWAVIHPLINDTSNGWHRNDYWGMDGVSYRSVLSGTSRSNAGGGPAGFRASTGVEITKVP